MEIIKINNKEYYRFKIGDEFEAISGKGSFNKMKKNDLTSDVYDEKNGFIYPFYDSSTKNNHIKGYCKNFNFKGQGIKTSISGDAGKSCFIKGKIFLGDQSYILESKNLETNFFISLFFNSFIPKFKQGSAIPNTYFRYFSNEYINIPKNHNELSDIIKKILDYQQLSQQLSQQLKDYKIAILQNANKKIKQYIKNNQKDKYIRFKIGDEFNKFSGRGKGMYSNLNASKLPNNINQYKLYTNVTQNNHIAGYVNNFNFYKKGIKWTENGDAGSTILIFNKVYIAEGANVLYAKSNNNYINEYLALKLNYWLKKFKQGSAQQMVKWVYFKDQYINIPKNHNELSDIIKKINKWEKLINITTSKMENYIKGVLQLSLKGVKNEW